MQKTLLAAAIGLALIGSASAADPVSITADNSTKTWTEADGNTPAYANQDVKGATGNEVLKIDGAWAGAILATSQDVTVSDLSEINIDISGLEDKTVGIQTLYAADGHSLTIENVGSLTAKTHGRQNAAGPQGPIVVQTVGGTLSINAAEDVTLEAEKTNVISSQLSSTSSGLVDITAGGTLSIKADSETYGAIVVMALQDSDVDGVNAALKLQAKNIKIEAKVDAIEAYDQDKKWNQTPGSGAIAASVSAVDTLEIKAGRYGLFQTRQSDADVATKMTAGSKISITGEQSAIRTKAPEGAKASSTVSISAPTAELNSSDSTEATVQIGSGTGLTFSGLNGGVTNVTVTNEAEQGKAISIAENATVSGTNAVLNVVKGDVAAENGTMTLTDSTVTLGEGVSMKLGTLNGTGTNTVALNSATSTATIKNATGHVVADFSDDALDSESETATFTVETFGEGATLTARARNNGTDAVTQFENVASRVDAGTSYDLTLEAAGINDGLYATWDADANESKGGVVNVRAGEENGVTHGLSQLAAVGYMQWRSAMNHMQYRLGEIRDQNGYNNGGWVRVYNGKDEFGSQNVENKYYGAQLGYDHKIAGTNVLVGGAFSYTRGESTFDLGEGDNYNYDFTLYGTWLADSGFFLDGTVKYGSLSNDVTFDRNNIAGAGTASYDTNAISVSAEAGWRFPVAGFAYVEPQAEVMYGHIWSADYSFNDIRVTNEAVDMTVGRLGVQAGLQCPNKKGGAYVRASVLHDFQGDADVTFRQGTNKVSLDEELGDTWYELGIGANWNVTDSTYVYADFNYTDGGEVESPWRWSLGVRMAW